MIWYALTVKPQKEFAAASVLATRGYHAFCPVETKLRRRSRHSRKKAVVEYPMIRSYVFASFPDENSVPWADLFRLSVVTGVVGFEGRPAAIPDRDMQAVMQRHGQNIPHRSSVNTHKALRPGDLAEVAYGVFVGQVVPIDSIKGQWAEVLTEMFGVKRKVRVKLDQLEAA